MDISFRLSGHLDFCFYKSVSLTIPTTNLSLNPSVLLKVDKFESPQSSMDDFTLLLYASRWLTEKRQFHKKVRSGILFLFMFTKRHQSLTIWHWHQTVGGIHPNLSKIAGSGVKLPTPMKALCVSSFSTSEIQVLQKEHTVRNL